MRILRHAIGIVDYQTLELPTGELLSVAQSRTLPDHSIDLWSIDRETGWPNRVGIYVIGTGNPMPDVLRSDDDRFNAGDPVTGEGWRRFIGTVVTPSGLVWHVFAGPVQRR
jgi:hypothetical protein